MGIFLVIVKAVGLILHIYGGLCIALYAVKKKTNMMFFVFLLPFVPLVYGFKNRKDLIHPLILHILGGIIYITITVIPIFQEAEKEIKFAKAVNNLKVISTSIVCFSMNTGLPEGKTGSDCLFRIALQQDVEEKWFSCPFSEMNAYFENGKIVNCGYGYNSRGLAGVNFELYNKLKIPVIADDPLVHNGEGAFILFSDDRFDYYLYGSPEYKAAFGDAKMMTDKTVIRK